MKKMMFHAKRLKCLSAMADIGEAIKRLREVGLQEWVCYVRPEGLSEEKSFTKALENVLVRET